jgi:hypothetical protein
MQNCESFEICVVCFKLIHTAFNQERSINNIMMKQNRCLQYDTMLYNQQILVDKLPVPYTLNLR